MSIANDLRLEFNAPREGVFAPYYFRYQGFLKDLSAPFPILRANGVYSLFALPRPHIYKNDLIVGNVACLHSHENSAVLAQAKNIVDRVGSRNFETNSDHYAPNYRHTLKVGVPGLIAEVDRSLEANRDDPVKELTLQGMRTALEGFLKLIQNYRDAAADLLDNGDYDPERLRFIIDNCTAISERAPESFAEGLQLVWLCHTAFMMESRYAMALGRFDQYLYPLYRADIDSGAITYKDAVELIRNTFTKIPTSDVVNICIGGTSPTGECEVNELSYATLEAVRLGNTPGTNLSARITHHTPDDFLRLCLESIGTGLGYPALMNDGASIPALESYGYSHEDVCDYSMVGCIENFITGMQPPWSDNRFDTPMYFDYVFNNGIGFSGDRAGLDTGDVEDISSMEEFLSRYERTLARAVDEYCLSFNSANAGLDQFRFTEPFLSCFCHDCIGRGLDINCGGAKYPTAHGAVIMGVGTVADSLAAIEKVVFVDKAATLSQVKEALMANFEGYESLRTLLLNAPKYGNDDDFADKYAVWFTDYLHGQFKRHRTRDGGAFYIAMAANTSNIPSGKKTSATPDGRLAGEPISDAASPTYGRDTCGPTATLLSVSKPDYTKVACGTVVNQKYSPSMFGEDRIDLLLSLVKTYFSLGGQEIQMNATSREVLIDAMEHPENHQGLVVRVSGFSAYYVHIPREVQIDILSRTQHDGMSAD